MTDRTPTGTPGEGAAPRDEAFDRLRAADPSAGATTDLDRLATTARERAGLDAGAATAPDGAPGADGELAEVRVLGAPRRRPARWLQIAAAVAGVAIIGGGGYALGASGDGTTSGTTADAAAPAIALQDSSGQEMAASDSSAGGAAKMATDRAGSWWYGGRTVFTQQGLSSEAGTGTAWGFDAASVVNAETAARLAQVLGVPGEPRSEYGSWVVGSSDGSGANLTVSADALASLSYYDPARDPWASCYASAVDTPTTEDDTAGSTEPAPAECTPSGAAAPAGDAAVAQARDVVADLGLDPDAWEYEAQGDTGTPQASYVTLWQVVDGQRTGVSGNVTFVSDGVQSLYLPLAPLVDLGTYDVVSAVEAVQRLSDPRFGASGGVMPLLKGPVAAEAASAEPVGPESTEPTVPPTPTAGAAIAWPVQQVTLVSSRLGVALTSLPDGSSVLVPSYELADADGSTWSVVAVVDDQLDFSPVG